MRCPGRRPREELRRVRRVDDPGARRVAACAAADDMRSVADAESFRQPLDAKLPQHFRSVLIDERDGGRQRERLVLDAGHDADARVVDPHEHVRVVGPAGRERLDPADREAAVVQHRDGRLRFPDRVGDELVDLDLARRRDLDRAAIVRRAVGAVDSPRRCRRCRQCRCCRATPRRSGRRAMRR